MNAKEKSQEKIVELLEAVLSKQDNLGRDPFAVSNYEVELSEYSKDYPESETITFGAKLLKMIDRANEKNWRYWLDEVRAETAQILKKV